MGTVLRGWGRAVSSSATVVAPPDDATLADHGRDLAVADHPRGTIARGAGRSYGDVAQNAGGRVVDMTTRNRIHRLDLQTGRARVDAGLLLDELLRAIVPHGWFVPVTPGTRMVTVAGAIAADIHGKNHPADGSIRRHLTGFTLLLADGTRRWVTPADSDVYAATLGGLGLTGLILDAELELRPITTTCMRLSTRITANLDETLAAMSGPTPTYRIATLDLLSRGGRLGRAVIEDAEHADVADLSGAVARNPLRYGPSQPLVVPDVVPNGVVNRTTLRALTTAVFARAARSRGQHIGALTSYFYPLDAIGQWNRAYGTRGFLQYQLVVPLGQELALARIAHRLSDARCPTFVAVLKRFGPGGGLLSFPIEGWTLAVDIPAGVAALSDLLAGCDDIVCEAGGRVYLAKDARLRADRVPVMYPELDRWQAIRDRLDPQRRWQSDLARRLDLYG